MMLIVGLLAAIAIPASTCLTSRVRTRGWTLDRRIFPPRSLKVAPARTDSPAEASALGVKGKIVV